MDVSLRILLADTNAALLQTIVELLERHFTIVGIFADGASVLRHQWPSRIEPPTGKFSLDPWRLGRGLALRRDVLRWWLVSA
jgi:hypothetical protein